MGILGSLKLFNKLTSLIGGLAALVGWWKKRSAGSAGLHPTETVRFCTAINCMDGRVQLPVIQYLQKRFNVDFVDSVTEAGPNLILSEAGNNNSVQSILSRVTISVEHHDSVGIAVVGHHDCAGNPAPRDEQVVHIQNAVRLLRQQYKNVEVTGLWVDSYWDAHEVS